jgi:ATP-dependent RNA helicase DeaD
MTFPVSNPSLQRALIERGYTEPTEVQLAVLRNDSADRDLLVSAQTGSGKTVAYGLAFASTILGDAESFAPARLPLVLVIAPTRELAIQVHGELTWLYEKTGARVVACVGGMDARREQRALAAGCHIVAGTPGRLQDHIQRGNLKLSECRVVVLDEADEMLDLGFRDELEFILQAAPTSRRTLLFSATIAKEIAALARQYQRDALRIDTVARNQPHADIEYRAIRVAGHEIEHGLVNLLRYHEARGSLVFCATREAVRRLHGRLLERGFAAVALSGELSQSERNAPDLDLVIHADLPTNKASLLHRSGRTGRAGRKGLCLLLVPNSKRRRAEMLLASANISALWADPPAAEEIRLRDQARLLADPVLTEAPLNEDIVLANELLRQQSPESIATALIRLYRARLPSPEEITVQPPPPVALAPFERRTDGAAMAWFRTGAGRRNNADPKWLIPLICRLGGITKQEIGVIRIFDRETKFEIAGHAAERFAAAAAAGNGDMVFERTAPPSGRNFPDPGPRPAKTKPARPIRTAHDKPNEQARRKKNRVANISAAKQ